MGYVIDICEDSPACFSKINPVVGTTVRVSELFWSLDAVPVAIDPLAVLLRLKDPHGNESSVTGTRTSLGNWFAEFVPTISGHWYYRWETSNPARVTEGDLYVAPSRFGTSTPPTDDTTGWGIGAWGEFPWPTASNSTPWGSSPWGISAWGN